MHDVIRINRALNEWLSDEADKIRYHAKPPVELAGPASRRTQRAGLPGRSRRYTPPEAPFGHPAATPFRSRRRTASWLSPTCLAISRSEQPDPARDASTASVDLPRGAEETAGILTGTGRAAKRSRIRRFGFES